MSNRKRVVALVCVCLAGFGMSRVKLYDTNELAPETLWERQGSVIIERIIGEVVSPELDGHILNGEEPYTYISYKGTDAQEGDLVETYCVYNPLTNYEDDIILRLDFVK